MRYSHPSLSRSGSGYQLHEVPASYPPARGSTDGLQRGHVGSGLIYQLADGGAQPTGATDRIRRLVWLLVARPVPPSGPRPARPNCGKLMHPRPEFHGSGRRCLTTDTALI